MKTWKCKFQKLCAVLLAVCLIAGCMQVSTAQAATSKSGTTYYYTHLDRQKGGKKLGWNGYYYNSGTMKIVCKRNTLIMYSSFNKSKNNKLDTSKKGFVKYGKHTFKLTSKTKYFSSVYDVHDGYRYMSKSQCISFMKQLNGLGLIIAVKNGKVVSIQLFS